MTNQTSKQFLPRLLGNSGILILGIILCVTWTIVAGKDLHWDLVNYHYYLPFSLLHDRLAKDFFPAGPQSYFNPLGYVPLYILDRIGLHSAITLSLLASFHSLNIFFLYKICKQYAGNSETIFVALAILISLLTQPFWVEVGNTHLDISTAVPIMAGVYILGTVAEKNAIQKAILAGFLFGLATGLKPTNAITTMPGIIFILMLGGPKRYKASLAYITFGLIGLITTGGYWAYKLYTVFGNPVFPLYNAYFRSPDFPAANLVSARFTPLSTLDFIFFPFRMALAQAWTYIEGVAPDIRFALCFPLLAILLLVQLIRSLKLNSNITQKIKLTRNELALIAYFLLIYYFWVKTSANGRYAIPQLLLIGPILLITISHLFPNKAGRTFLLLTLIIQMIIMQNTMQARLTPAKWSSHLFDVKIPDKLTKEPTLFLSAQIPSSSYLAPYLNPDSAFVNIRGQFTLTLDGPGGNKLQALIKKYSGHIRSLNLLGSLNDASDSSEWFYTVNSIFARYSLKIDREKCVIFALNITDTRKQLYMSCLLIDAPAEYKVFMDEIAPVDKIFDKIESLCPKMFVPAHPATEHVGEFWKRRYMNDEIDLIVEDNNIAIHSVYSLNMIPLGTLNDWANEKIPQGAERFCGIVFNRTEMMSKLINGR